MERKTKIIATIGPSSNKEEVIYQLINEGVDSFRLNFSHGKREEYKEIIQNIRKCAEMAKKHVSVFIDLQGPKIRIGELKNNIELKTGEEIILTSEELIGNESIIYVSYPYLLEELDIGKRVLIDDGKIELEVLQKVNNGLKCKVLVGGILSSKKGINFPGTELTKTTALTSKDKEDVIFGIKEEIDFFAISFVQRASDILELKELLYETNSKIPVIAKIEKQEAYKNLSSIIDVSDGIMVARGDLGVEFPLEDVPIIQKKIIKLCNLVGKPVIIATQMLDSMVTNHRPTRAEVTDISNGIFDGADALLVTNETAIGKYPIEVVKTMKKIILRTERELRFNPVFDQNIVTISQAIGRTTCELAHILRAKAIITATQSGETARQVARYRPLVPIIAATPNLSVCKQLSIVRGVYPILIPISTDTNSMIEVIIKKAKEENLIQPNDTVIITAGLTTGISGTTNMIKIERV